MTSAAAVLDRQSARRSRLGSLASPFLRHGLILVGGAVAAYLLRSYLPAEQTVPWLAAGVVFGLLAGLIGGGWIGLLFAALGPAIGVMLEMQLDELSVAAPTLLAAGGLVLLGYAAVLVGFALLRRRAV